MGAEMGALLIATLLKCPNGEALEEEVSQVEGPVNDLRWSLINGTQRNGPNGTIMPKPEWLGEVMWNCSLEREAIHLLEYECSRKALVTSDRTVLLISVTGDRQSPFVSAMRVWTNELNKTAMEKSAIGNDSVTYDGNVLLRDYANLARANTTRIGCAQKSCSQIGASPGRPTSPLVKGEVIYEVRK
ncbi:hypothetical protein ANCCEY_01925 [Ancylostoma ceylanicum]|uniref:SCP domain-containing protein n=1 Tax=Ancylostoma ceylanicum TaxID=53326 RepID=A0A0D6M4B1_9BILA|nr:hypothetical protein ANCCEY_01925 [Ancylostoma ceylanicum]